MSLMANFKLMAEYNRAMNRNVYHAASTLTPLELSKNQSAFFGSIINTLNHILVGDTIWLQRFAHHTTAFPSLDYVLGLLTPATLDTVLYTDFAELKAKREKMDDVIVSFILELTNDVVAEPLLYTNTRGLDFKKNFGHVLQHFFNHQTHHRGQVSTLLYQQGIDVGVTDLLVYVTDVE
ncbi:DinB family protein [Alteromonadaceae bacterium BrNp21-10]|nr:DinB family protein [Alteromonadaceae bacterium BrNp21-10]